MTVSGEDGLRRPRLSIVLAWKADEERLSALLDQRAAALRGHDVDAVVVTREPVSDPLVVRCGGIRFLSAPSDDAVGSLRELGLRQTAGDVVRIADDLVEVRPSLSVIVDAAAEAFDDATLVALAASTLARDEWELIVVSPPQSDAATALCAAHADAIVRLGDASAHGPGYRRNRAAEMARGDVLVFLGADVVVRPDALERITSAFGADRTLAALVGRLDPRSTCPNARASSALRRHGLPECQARGRVEHLSTRCGAVRTEAFFDAGQFNEWDVRPGQWMDADFGRRLRAHGHRIELHDDVAGTSGGKWRFADVVQAQRPGGRGRGEVQVAMLAFVSLGLSGYGVATGRTTFFAVAALAMCIALANQASAFVHLARRGEIWLALAAPPMRVIAGLVVGGRSTRDFVRHCLIGDPRPPAGVEALAEVGVDAWPPVPVRARRRNDR